MKDPDLFNIIWAAFEPSPDSMLLSYNTLNPPPLVFLDKFCSLSCPGVAPPSPPPLLRLLKTRPLRKDKYLYLYVHKSHYRRFDREGGRGGNLTLFFFFFFYFSKRHEPKDPLLLKKWLWIWTPWPKKNRLLFIFYVYVQHFELWQTFFIVVRTIFLGRYGHPPSTDHLGQDGWQDTIKTCHNNFCVPCNVGTSLLSATNLIYSSTVSFSCVPSCIFQPAILDPIGVLLAHRNQVD